jgi:cytochrome c6
MTSKRRSFVSRVEVRLTLLVAMLFAATALAAAERPPLWITAKCAVCHGRDGSGNTDTGRKLAVRDLRLPEVRKRTDQELAKSLSAGHKRMPAFRNQLRPDQVQILVKFIRGLAAPAPKP